MTVATPVKYVYHTYSTIALLIADANAQAAAGYLLVGFTWTGAAYVAIYKPQTVVVL